MSRTLTEHDRVAEQRRDGTWQIGTVTGSDSGWLVIRWDDTSRATVRHANDTSRLVDVDDVPIDERHWVPEKVRDQLIRQEAARRLRAMYEHLPPGEERLAGVHLARHFDDLIYHPDPGYVDAARALLSLAPALTPGGAR